MKIYSPTDDFVGFLHLLSTKKREFASWRYLRIFLGRSEKRALPIDEIIQFMGFHFQKSKPLVLKIPQSNDLVILTLKDQIITLNKFEKGLLEQFKGFDFQTEGRSLDASGLETLVKMVRMQISPGDPVLRTLVTRLSRLGNRIMVVDENANITAKLEKILSGFGYVVALNKTDRFLEQYIEYAPDVLFLDGNATTAHGTEFLQNLIKRIDPHAYVIMMGKSPTKEIVLDIKNGGAKGFVLKPFTPEVILQHIARIPVFSIRSDSSHRV